MILMLLGWCLGVKKKFTSLSVNRRCDTKRERKKRKQAWKGTSECVNKNYVLWLMSFKISLVFYHSFSGLNSSIRIKNLWFVIFHKNRALWRSIVWDPKACDVGILSSTRAWHFSRIVFVGKERKRLKKCLSCTP